MSLSSFLLSSSGGKSGGKGKTNQIDNDLFSLTVVAPVAPSIPATTQSSTVPSSVSSSEKKRKSSEEASSSSKRTKQKHEPAQSLRSERRGKEDKRFKSQKSVAPGQDDEDSDDELHIVPAKVVNVDGLVEDQIQVAQSSSEEGSDEESDPSKLVHESLLEGGNSKGKARARRRSAKFVPEEESSGQRDARTVFIGNVSVEVAKSRPLLKQLKKHILSHVPSAKIESIRLRSVAFQKPTAAPSDSDPKGKHKESESEGRQHDRDRAASWRAKKRGEDEADEAAAVPEKKFLTTAEKKRVAFIKSEIHSGVDSVNAYVVFAHPVPDDSTRPANLPSRLKAMDPYEAAMLAAERCDGTTFLERTIRVDVVKKGARGFGARSGEMDGDVKRTLFVGSLDFASKEEDLRVFFEALISAERGPPPATEEDEDEDEGSAGQATAKANSWVRRVRIIRDKDTLLGKGFAYVQFADRECVDEILSLEETRLKFAKRKLRVQRCKTIPGAKTKVTSAAPSAHAPSTSKLRPSWPIPAGPAPKGDPMLGSKISHLSKEERKNVKKSDADRVARRLAKKAAKNKMALVEKGLKAQSTDRERTRKRPKDHKQKSGEKGKGRVRSAKAISKLNTKK